MNGRGEDRFECEQRSAASMPTAAGRADVNSVEAVFRASGVPFGSGPTRSVNLRFLPIFTARATVRDGNPPAFRSSHRVYIFAAKINTTRAVGRETGAMNR
jgi:hypothetical protein